MKNKKTIIIVGGGFSGMVTAFFAKKLFRDHRVYLVEKNNILGGLYNSVTFKKKFIFDHGMHLFYQCKNKVINSFFFKILKKSQWHILKGVKKDVAGIFYDGKLNVKSPYINLEEMQVEKKIEYINDISKYISKKIKKNKSQSMSLESFFFFKFGKKLTYKLINPIIKKFWGFNSNKIDAVASKLILMDRVNFFKKNLMDKLIEIRFFRERFGYPDQLNLPKKFQSKQTYGLYPKKFGMFNVIKSLERILFKSKINIRSSAKINSFKISNRKINEMTIQNNLSSEKIKNISFVLWTVPVFGLIPLLNLRFGNLNFDKNRKQIFVYILSKERPKMDGSYYFMCFDKGFATFRVTSYFEYCSNSKIKNNYYPICMEMHFNDDNQVLNYKKIALKELSKFKILNKISSVKYIFVEKAFGFFPVMSLKNTNSIRKIKKRFFDLNLKNIYLATQSPERGVFFMHDVLDQNINLLYKLKNVKTKNK